jgi:uncharacterized membrane protein YfcA
LIIDFSAVDWILVTVGAVSIGIGKTGIPGINMFFVPVIATILPAKESTGFLLPLLIAADIFAVIYYKSHAQWRHLAKLIPFSLLGIGIGYFAMKALDDAQIKPIIGIIVLAMLAIQSFRMWRKKDESIPKGIWFALVLGLLAGFSTMVANAAGPAVTIYLLAMRLPKEQYVGTSAWYYFIVNLAKVPLSASLGLITAKSLVTNAIFIPAIVIGAFAGILVLSRIPQKAFVISIIAITAVAAIRLLF